MLGPRLLFLFMLLAGYILSDVAALAVWGSDRTLWPHAARVAPTKPRPLINYAKQLFADGRDREAVDIIVRVEDLEATRGRR